MVTTVRVAPTGDGSRLRRQHRRAERAGLVGWAAVVTLALVWGSLRVADAGVGIRAAPLMGRWDEHVGWALAPAAALGAAAAWWGPPLAARLPWRRVLWATALTTVAWTVALAASDGWDRLTEPLTTRHEYEPAAAQVDDIGAYVRGFVDQLGDQPIHVQGHPPGPVVLAWLLDQIGLGGAGWLAVVALAGWGLAAACALVAARAVAGESAARRAASALAVLPAAVWAGTSLDALFAGVIALALCLVVLAGVRPNRRSDLAASAEARRPNGSAGRQRARRTPVLGLAGGVAGGCALMFTYGAVPLLLAGTAVAVALAPRSLELAVAAGLGALAVLGAAAAAGFWWPDGLAATQNAYWSGLGGRRPAVYLTLAGNPAALALATGPAAALGLASLASDRRRQTPHPAAAALMLSAAAFVAVVLADVSQLARGEVERIWLPFVPWLALAAPGDRRGWLMAQVALALVLQSVLVSPW